jgi:hypothetical protein
MAKGLRTEPGLCLTLPQSRFNVTKCCRSAIHFENYPEALHFSVNTLRYVACIPIPQTIDRINS